MISLTPHSRRDTHKLWVHLLVALISLFSFTSYAQNGAPCYKPLLGPGASARVVENGVLQVNSGLFTPLINIIDGDTSNFASNQNVLGTLSQTGVSVKTTQIFPLGWRAGFVVEYTGGTLGADLLGGISLQTFKNGSLVSTASAGTGLSVTLLKATTSGKLYLNFASSGDFDEVRFLINSTANLNVLANTLRVYHAMAFDPNCGNNENNNICEDQIAGPGTVVNYSAGLLNAVGSLTNRNNIIDGNKNTAGQLLLPAGTGVLSNPVYVGVTDLFNVYPSGNKAGFVIRANSALLTADVLNNVKIQTYLFGNFVGEATFSNGTGLLSLSALSFGTDDKKKLEFTSPGKFNEVRIVFGSGIDVSTATTDIYYAYESGSTCTDCRSYFSNVSPTPTGSIAASIRSNNNYPNCIPVVLVNACNWTGAFGLLSGLTNGVENSNRVINASQSDFAKVTVNLGALGAGARLTVQSDALQPANSFAGFEITRNNEGILGLLDVAALGGITIRAFNGNTEVDSKSASALLNAGLLTGTGGRTVIGFRPNGQYNRLVFEVNSGLVSADIEYRVYNAFVILDDDGDGTPNCIDQCPAGDDSIDSDGDGTPDCKDTCNGNNSKSASIDTDGDGLFNNCDDDSDNDGIPDAIEGVTDADGDGIPNYLDLDSDNDGILDLYEGGLTPAQIQANSGGNGVLNGQNPVAVTMATLRDTDGDGVPDYLDLDSDNDGINDIIESGFTGLTDTNNDGVVDGPDADGDGIQDSADGNDSGFGSASVVAPKDRDGDGAPDYRDLDSDNDGIKDLTESGRLNLGTLDTNNDGVLDGPDADGDGIRDNVDTEDAMFGSPAGTAPKDTDGDLVPDFRDLDSDNDGVKDLYESGLPNPGTLDPDGNGVINLVADADNDGIQDSVDQAKTTFGSPDGPALKDTDGDTVPDFRDLDSDNDGIKDLYESGLPNLGTLDTDKNGVIDTGTDADQDGIQDSVDNVTSGPGAFGSTDLPAPIDSDGDGVPDVRDLDSDNDGINDIVENGDPAVIDANGDGQVDGVDNDKDGIRGGADTADNVFGSPNSATPLNSDNDPLPNFQDLDSDNDSISDLVESGDTNAIDSLPEDGVVDGPDTDGDGIRDSVDNYSGFGDNGSPAPKDTDSDGKPDYIDTDSNNDGKNDIVENGNGGLDKDNGGSGDGMVDGPIDDPDKDGIANNGGLDEKPGDFGGLSQNAAKPDLTPVIFSNASTYNQTQSRDVVIKIINKGNAATSGPVVFYIPLMDPTFSISINGSATVANVDDEPTASNPDWDFVKQDTRYQVTLKDGFSIPGSNGSKQIVITLNATGTKTSTATVSAQILSGTGGGETPTTNNTVTYKISINL